MPNMFDTFRVARGKEGSPAYHNTMTNAGIPDIVWPVAIEEDLPQGVSTKLVELLEAEAFSIPAPRSLLLCPVHYARVHSSTLATIARVLATCLKQPVLYQTAQALRDALTVSREALELFDGVDILIIDYLLDDSTYLAWPVDERAAVAGFLKSFMQDGGCLITNEGTLSHGIGNLLADALDDYADRVEF